MTCRVRQHTTVLLNFPPLHLLTHSHPTGSQKSSLTMPDPSGARAIRRFWTNLWVGARVSGTTSQNHLTALTRQDFSIVGITPNHFLCKSPKEYVRV